MHEKLLEGLSSLLITHPINIRYLTNFVGLSDNHREAYLLVTKDKLYLFTSALYLEQAKKLANSWQPTAYSKLEIVEISQDNPFPKALAKLVTQLKIQRLGFEQENLTVSEFNKLTKQLSATQLVPTQDRVETLRQIKKPNEIEHIRQAAKLTDQGFDFILPHLKPRVTETEIAWQIETFFRKKGAGIAFSPIVAFNENSSQPHYSPSSNFELRTNNLVLLDFGARVNGYCADMTRVVFIGQPTTEQKRVYETVLAAQQKVLNSLSDHFDELIHQSEAIQFSGAQLDKIARSIIEKAGFPPYPHSLGHSLGLAIHEAPRLTIKKDAILKPGMVFTIEPAVYIEGKFGIRIEDLVLLKKDGIDILSKSPKELIVL